MTKKQWPQRSPDRNPCDYYLWSYFQSEVYKPLPETFDDLKENITREIQKINTSILESTFLNFTKRTHLLFEKNGGHIDKK